MAPIALFPFRYRDARTGKWVRPRYRATREEIAARYADWELAGGAELRGDDPVQMWGLLRRYRLGKTIAALP